MSTEADTCRKYVLPKLYAAGWTDDQICEQRSFTDGRIVTIGAGYYRKRADYLLGYLDGLAGQVAAQTRPRKDSGEPAAETAAELDALLPSVLDKVFKGEL